MSRWFKYGIVVAAIVVLAILANGCGDDKKGTNSNTLSTEDQFNEVSKFFSFDPDGGDPDAIDVTGLVLSLMTPQYWDGVDPEDVGGSAKHMFPSPKLAGVDTDSLYYNFDAIHGWWVVYYHLTSSGQGASLDLTFRDSVRFENAQGTPQVEPNENTARVKLYQHLTALANSTSSGLAADAGDHLELGTTADSRFEVTRATLTDVQVDGAANVTLNLLAHSGDTASADIDFGLNANYDAVTIPIPDQATDACPTDGDVSAGMDISIAVTSGDESASADGSWDASVSFTGNGNATVNVESGDFSKQFSGQACNPNP